MTVNKVEIGDLIQFENFENYYGVVVKEIYNDSPWDDAGMSGVYSTFFDVLVPKTGEVVKVNYSLAKFKNISKEK